MGWKGRVGMAWDGSGATLKLVADEMRLMREMGAEDEMRENNMRRRGHCCSVSSLQQFSAILSSSQHVLYDTRCCSCWDLVERRE